MSDKQTNTASAAFKHSCYNCGHVGLDKTCNVYCQLRSEGGRCIAYNSWTPSVTIKTPEQFDVLDKIRAEIEQNAYPIVHGANNHELGMTLYGILQVIDKYTTGGNVK